MSRESERQDQRMAQMVAAAAAELATAGMPSERAQLAAQAGVAAASAMAQHKSVFALRDWERQFALAAGDGWLGEPKWGEFRGLVARAVGLLPLAAAQSDKDWAKWSPASHERAEIEMIALAKRLDARHGIEPELVERAIAARPGIAPEQAEAARASCLGDKAVVVTEGTAGAGKSFTLEVIKEAYQQAPETRPGEGVGYHIVGTAFSWNAAKVLQESAKLDSAQALAGLLNEMDRAKADGQSYFKRRTLVILDEAGLVDTMNMRALLRHAADAPVPVRVLLTGDSLQLNPVQAGNALEAIVEECGSSRLNTIRRQERESHKAAVLHFCFGRAEQGLWTYWQQEALWMSPDAEARRERVMRDYVRNLAAHPLDACLVLALDNAEVRKLNEQIRERLKGAGLLAGDEHELTVNDSKGAYKAKFCVGDRVVFRKNLREHPVHESRYGQLHEAGAEALRKGVKQREAGMFSKMISALAGGRFEPLGKEVRKGVFNRGNGIVLGIKKSSAGAGDRVLRVLLSEGGEVEIDTADLRDKMGEGSKAGIQMHHNFATTIYASQGQTVQRVLMMDSPMMNRRLAYVGMSRHKVSCDVYADAADLTARKKKRAQRALKFQWSPREKKRAQADLDAEGFSEGDLWAEMALAWNNEDPNPTVLQAKKRMAEKRERSSKEGSQTGRLRPAEGDDADDAEQMAQGAIPTRAKPPSYEELVAELAASARPAKKAGFFQTLLGSAELEPEPAPGPGAARPSKDPGPGALPAWSAEALPAKALAELDGVVWGRNRWGEPRLFALDRQGAKTSRWTMEGELAAGRGEPPVLPNAPDSPWMVVSGAREALISWSHFQEKWKAAPERAPSVAVAFEGADLSALSEWVKPGQALHCAWSKKDPASLDWARATAAKLEALGYKAAVYPKADPAAAALAAPAPAAPARVSGP